MTTSLRVELPARSTGRILALDELKGVAILLVILYHAGGALVWSDTLHLEVGVDMFVILSGIGLALSTTEETAGRFLLRRMWRIYPCYWIILTGFLVANARFLGEHDGTKDVVLHYLGVHALFGDAHMMTINDSFWFVTLIVLLYALYAMMRRLVDRPDWVLFLGAAASVGLSLAYFYSGEANVFRHLTTRMPGFFLGVVIGRLLATGRIEIPLTWALGAACAIVLYVPYANGIILASFLVGLSLMALYALALRPALAAGVRRTLRFLGDRSLEIFLIHQPLMRNYNTYVQRRIWPTRTFTPWSLAAGMAAGLAAAILISSALHSLLRRLPGPGRGRPAGAAR